MQKTILIIEDDQAINDMLCQLLTGNNFDVIQAFSGTEGLLVHNSNIALILLDLMLPGKSGDELVQELKHKHNVPIIIMSAIHEVTKKVMLFDLGADDYITKPFHNDELLARIKVQLRKLQSDTTSSILVYKDIQLKVNDYEAICNQKELLLTKHEFDLLKILMENAKATVTKSVLFDKVWNDENSADENTLNVHISKLRTKLKECNPKEEYIETIWSIGYRMKK